jgi:hypothetical protein
LQATLRLLCNLCLADAFHASHTPSLAFHFQGSVDDLPLPCIAQRSIVFTLVCCHAILAASDAFGLCAHCLAIVTTQYKLDGLLYMSTSGGCNCAGSLYASLNVLRHYELAGCATSACSCDSPSTTVNLNFDVKYHKQLPTSGVGFLAIRQEPCCCCCFTASPQPSVMPAFLDGQDSASAS